MSAGYLAALYNSTLYQEIASSLPPGQLRKAELQRIGVPLRNEYEASLSQAAEVLAVLVTDLVRRVSPQFPMIAYSMRQNVALTDTTDHVWVPRTGPKMTWGTLGQVTWVEDVSTLRAASTALDLVHVSETLFGFQIEVTVRGSEARAAVVTLGQESSADLAEALAANVRAVAVAGGKVKGLFAVEGVARAGASVPG